ncbi:MAG: ATP-binding cassette domain-containing protein [Peptococcaceae bacterium]|nr:ATP-binding cassette domain-containing protein [Peptococcaceae bacterium]
MGGRLVIKDISFDVDDGGYVCIMGVNGSGKSTLLRALLGLVPVAEGSILLGDGLKRSDIGYAAQRINLHRDFPATVWEVVLSGCLNRRGPRPYFSVQEKELAEAGLARLGMTNDKKALFRDLSGGQQQRVMLARACCAARRLLVLDEPAQNLDKQGERLLIELLAELNQTQKITVIFVTHDQETAQRAQRMLILDKGACVFWGKPSRRRD